MFRRKRGFTLIELLVVISIIALLISILLPALEKARSSAQKIKNTANVRSMLQGLAMFGDQYDGQYPNSNLPDIPGVNGWNGDFGASPNQRAAALVYLDYVTEDILLSPSDEAVKPHSELDETPPGPANPVARGALSYAMLDLPWNVASIDGNPEWQHNLNAEGPLLADRTLSTFDWAGSGSVWRRGKWEGTVGWGDGHADYEEDKSMRTRFNGEVILNDNIWGPWDRPGDFSNFVMNDPNFN
jgi:prepilin-type N-terminal cleavage/methylation domain-containing protein